MEQLLSKDWYDILRFISNPWIIIPAVALSIFIEEWKNKHGGDAGYVIYSVFSGFLLSFVYSFLRISDAKEAFFQGGAICIVAYFIIKIRVFGLVRWLIAKKYNASDFYKGQDSQDNTGSPQAGGKND